MADVDHSQAGCHDAAHNSRAYSYVMSSGCRRATRAQSVAIVHGTQRWRRIDPIPTGNVQTRGATGTL